MLFQSLHRSHACQVESISVSKSAHARGAGGGGEKREKHEAGNRNGTRNACRTLLLHSSTRINQFYSCCGLVKTERRRGRAVCLPVLRCLHREQPEHAPVRWPPQLRLLRGHASRRFFLMGVRPHGDSFGGKPNGLQSQAGQQRSHPYGKAVLAARASSPPAVQDSRVVVILNQCTPPFKHASSGSWRRDLPQCVVSARF